MITRLLPHPTNRWDRLRLSIHLSRLHRLLSISLSRMRLLPISLRRMRLSMVTRLPSLIASIVHHPWPSISITLRHMLRHRLHPIIVPPSLRLLLPSLVPQIPIILVQSFNKLQIPSNIIIQLTPNLPFRLTLFENSSSTNFH